MYPQDLNFYIEKLVEVINDVIDDGKWDSILITEKININPGEKVSLNKNNVWKPTEYEERFKELLSASYGWLNMSACGVLHRQLIIDLEWPNTPEESAKNTSVNLSGPFKWVQDKGCCLADVVGIN